GEHAVRVDEDGNPPERERLVESPGPVADPPRAQCVVASGQVLDVRPPDLRPPGLVERRIHRPAAALAAQEDADVDGSLPHERFERAGANEHVLRMWAVASG